MRYQVVIKRSAEKELDALSERLRLRVAARLLSLGDNPRPSGIGKLQGGDGYRLRIGDYRVLYTIDDSNRIVTVFAIGHRRDIYRRE
jgi:mRNA interferase RelE/StbE